MRRGRRRRVERCSHPILSKLIDDARHRPVLLSRVRSQCSPSSDTFRSPHDRQRNGGRIKWDDTTDGDAPVGQNERLPLADQTKNAPGFVSQLALRETLGVYLTRTHATSVAPALHVEAELRRIRKSRNRW